MKRRLLFLLIMIAAASVPANAQMDSWMLDQWLNQMNMDVIQQQQQLGRQFQELVEAETQRQADMASATCIMLPNGNDTFFGYITFLYLSKDRVELTMTDASGRNTVLPSSDYFYTFGKMLTPAIFTPGSKLTVSDKTTGKVYSTSSIPRKSSPRYESYVRNGYAIAKSLGAQGGGSYDTSPSYGGTTQGNTVTTTCSLCGGKGWIAGNKTPTYGSTTTRWCDACRQEVAASHSHDQCPSCGGKGTIGKIR